MSQYSDVFQKENMQNMILWITGLAWFYKEKEIISIIRSTSGRFWAYTDICFGKITHASHQQNVMIVKENIRPYSKQKISTTLLSIQHNTTFTSLEYFYGILRLKSIFYHLSFIPFEADLSPIANSASIAITSISGAKSLGFFALFSNYLKDWHFRLF